jgi:lipopolysaccharide biosynthesis glycosyltransferase
MQGDDLQKLRRSVAPRETSIEFVSHTIDYAPLVGLLRSKHISHMAYARLLAGSVLDSSVERVVYVDVDVLFLRDICELYEMPLDGMILAAVPNGPPEEQQEQLQRLGIAASGYFASGLMVIDLARWRKDRIGERALGFAETLGDKLVLHDQDALNGVVQGNFLALPSSWCHVPADGVVEEDVVVHYAMVPKPWHADYDGPYRADFFEYLDRTAFAGWRPREWFGLAPKLSRLVRSLPYPPTVLRLLRQRTPWRGQS